MSSLTRRHAAAAPAARGERRWNLTVACVLVLGVAVLIYPMAARWFSDSSQAREVTGYSQAVAGLPSHQQSALLEAAQQYNADLPRGPLRNPYRPDGVAQQTAVGDFTEAYFAQLAVPGSETMGRLTVPAIGVDLPIMHGTDEATLARGVGHLFGSSLPVGGESTHSVLTAHSGFVTATLFDDLDRVVLGDTFTITVLGQEHHYRVDQIVTVLPTDSDELMVTEGEDYVTLVTCTPTGINTHRLLVRGERIDASEFTQTPSQVTMPGRGQAPGFPWWSVALGGAGLLGVLIGCGRRQRSPSDVAPQPEPVPERRG